MSRYIDIYNWVIMAIDLVFNCGAELTDTNLSLSFDWSKVKWAFDFWLTERRSIGPKFKDEV